MRNIKIYKLLLLSLFALITFSCDDDPKVESVVTSFAPVPVTLNSTPIVVSELDQTIEETDSTYTINFSLGDKQIYDTKVIVGVGETSTATEDVDFVIETHEYEFDALAGQDGFDVKITVLEDRVLEGEDETIYLTFTTELPSGIDKSEILVATIKDSGLLPQAGVTSDFTLSWDYTDPLAADIDPCELDLDLTIQPTGTASYDADIMDNAAATSDCIEHGSAALADMVDGEVYDVFVWIYGGRDYGVLGALKVTLDFERENTTVNGTHEITNIFNSNQNDVAIKIGTIVKNGTLVTVKDIDGNVLSQG